MRRSREPRPFRPARTLPVVAAQAPGALGAPASDLAGGPAGRDRPGAEAGAGAPSGNWYVVGATRDVGADRPLARTVAGQEVVVWRDAEGGLVAGPGVCPHLGAPLRDSPVRCGTLVCHWHGLALKGTPFAGWEPLPVHDDGLLVWVRLDGVGGEPPLDAPVVPVRPALPDALAAVYVGVGTCQPEDVVANRLDPWHGAWFHPYSFVDLTVVDVPEAGATGAGGADGFAVDVSFKLAGRLVVPVRAVFTAPEPRTVVMHITEGEGQGSVVETHATPSAPTTGAGRGQPSSRRSFRPPTVAGSPPRARWPRCYGRSCGPPPDACGATTWHTPSGAGSCAPPAASPAEADSRDVLELGRAGPARRPRFRRPVPTPAAERHRSAVPKRFTQASAPCIRSIASNGMIR